MQQKRSPSTTTKVAPTKSSRSKKATGCRSAASYPQTGGRAASSTRPKTLTTNTQTPTSTYPTNTSHCARPNRNTRQTQPPARLFSQWLPRALLVPSLTAWPPQWTINRSCRPPQARWPIARPTRNRSPPRRIKSSSVMRCFRVLSCSETTLRALTSCCRAKRATYCRTKTVKVLWARQSLWLTALLVARLRPRISSIPRSFSDACL